MIKNNLVLIYVIGSLNWLSSRYYSPLVSKHAAHKMKSCIKINVRYSRQCNTILRHQRYGFFKKQFMCVWCNCVVKFKSECSTNFVTGNVFLSCYCDHEFWIAFSQCRVSIILMCSFTVIKIEKKITWISSPLKKLLYLIPSCL